MTPTTCSLSPTFTTRYAWVCTYTTNNVLRVFKLQRFISEAPAVVSVVSQLYSHGLEVRQHPGRTMWQSKAAHVMAHKSRGSQADRKQWRKIHPPKASLPPGPCFFQPGPISYLPLLPAIPSAWVAQSPPRGSSSDCCRVRRHAYHTGVFRGTLHVQTVTLLRGS